MAEAAHPPHRHLSPETIRFCPLCGAGLAPKPIDPDKRPEMVCSGCEFIFYVNQKVVAGTIPWQDGRLLLTRRAIEPAIGKWTFPGGYVDWGETVDAAALRETWEETGLRVELGGHALPRERPARVGDSRGGPVGGSGLSLDGGGDA